MERVAGLTYAYTYDAGGNLLTETVNGTVNTYVYDSVWKDKLFSYNGKAITYDAAGHPLNYMGSTMTWDVSDRLTAISGATVGGNGGNIAYTYLSDGSRRSKTVNGVTTTYHYNNGLLLSQTTGDETLYFYYDSTGNVTSMGYKKGSADEAGYFFTRNAQGDIIGVYRSSDSKLIGTYEYDLWGRPVSVTEATAGIDTDGILTKNPFRYRGYYYDEETGFYYLNARYYDPTVRRFISADSVIASPGSSVEGHNMFGYCFNNPVNQCDPSGYWPCENLVKFQVKNFYLPIVQMINQAGSNVDITVSHGLEGCFTPGAFVFEISGGVSLDTKGNISLQASAAGGVIVCNPGWAGSLTNYTSVSNAPDIEKLGGPSYQLGGSLGAPVVGIPLVAGADVNIIPDGQNTYFGITCNKGIGASGEEFHVKWGETKNIDGMQINVFNIIYDVFDYILEV